MKLICTSSYICDDLFLDVCIIARYRGVFGTHVAALMRRFLRLCFLYASNPQIVYCSASIQNPEEHFRWLIPELQEKDQFLSRPLTVLEQDKDGSPMGEKVFLIWNSQSRQENNHGSSGIYQSAQVLSSLVLSNIATIAFCRVRVQSKNMLELNNILYISKM